MFQKVILGISILLLGYLSFKCLTPTNINIINEEPMITLETLYHGYTFNPKSRAYLCRQGINKNCGSIMWEPQSIEGYKGFPKDGPNDGELANGGNKRFINLNEVGIGRWVFEKLNIQETETSYIIPVQWYLTAVHRTTKFALYIPRVIADETSPISRNMFNLENVCVDNFESDLPDTEYNIACKFPKKYLKYLLNKHVYLYAVWDIYDTKMAFYQLSDVILSPNKSVDFSHFKQINVS